MDVQLLKQHIPVLVALSVAIAVLASYSALELSGRIHASSGRARSYWLLGAAIVMGVGIWSMHFVGMLALNLPTLVDYSTGGLAASIAFAIGAAVIALWIAARPQVSQPQLAAAAVVMGTGIAGMHYIGMAGMRMAAHIRYDASLFRLSIAIAIVVSYAALYMTRLLRSDTMRRPRFARVSAAVVMGFAIAGMHYTAMAAAHFEPVAAVMPAYGPLLPPMFLAGLIAVASILLVGLSLIAAMLDRLLRARVSEAQLRSETQAAVAMNRAKSEFLANMSHELRTPLNSIIGFSNILLKNKAGNLNPGDITHLSRIAANGKHLLGMINGVLDLSKIEAGRVELELEWLDLPALIHETVDEMAAQADANEVRLLADLPEDVLPLNGDATRLKQILINLLGNAVKFSRGGRVTIRVVAHARTHQPVRIDVIDTGIGIRSDRLASVFDAFQQADSATTRTYGGTGLGLTITRSLAELMGWTVTVESTLGVGTTFSVVMGAMAEGQATAATVTASHRTVSRPPAPVAATDGRPFVVLVIDDEADARELLHHELTELDCLVYTVSSADEGISLARTLKPDLITLDLLMPVKNGWQALRELKADHELSGIPVAIISSVGQESRLQGSGAIGLVEKPVTQEKLRYLIPFEASDDRVTTLLSSLRERRGALRLDVLLDRAPTEARQRKRPA